MNDEYGLEKHNRHAVLPERNEVILGRESHNTFAVLFWYWEEILEHVLYPLAELG